MHFPEDPVVSGSVTDSMKAAFAAALGIHEDKIAAIAENKIKDIIIELSPHRDFSAQAMSIDPKAMLQASPPGTGSQIVTGTGAGHGNVDFVKRVFAFGTEGKSAWLLCLNL